MLLPTGRHTCSLPVGNSCSSGWETCQPGCNPGLYDNQRWRCPDHPEIHTGDSCPTGWRMCNLNACASRLDSVEVYVGIFVADPNATMLTSSPPQFIGGGGGDDMIRQYLDGELVGVPPPILCDGPIYVDFAQHTVVADCPPTAAGDFIYIRKPDDNSVLTLCEVTVVSA